MKYEVWSIKDEHSSTYQMKQKLKSDKCTKSSNVPKSNKNLKVTKSDEKIAQNKTIIKKQLRHIVNEE